MGFLFKYLFGCSDMQNNCLLTSFQTWLPHQKSNSSDDLLEILADRDIPEIDLFFLRQLPVDINLASERIIKEMERRQFQIIICCGMAESRTNLTVESHANFGGEQIYSSVDLDDLVRDLSFTTISHDAGKFVCEGLYFKTLDRLRKQQRSSSCIFVHVPIIDQNNRARISSDFIAIVRKLNQYHHSLK
jgi:pyroglutamyl-peptidase